MKSNQQLSSKKVLKNDELLTRKNVKRLFISSLIISVGISTAMFCLKALSLQFYVTILFVWVSSAFNYWIISKNLKQAKEEPED